MMYLFFNGDLISSQQACLQHSDRSFTLGHGLFETILMKQGTMPFFDYHWQRLSSSAPIVGIQLPFSAAELKTVIERLADKNELQNKIAAIRLTVSCGAAERGLLPPADIKPNVIIAISEYVPIPHAAYTAYIVSMRKNEYAPSSRIKSTSYLDNILAKQEAASQGYDEAILLNTASYVADGALSNIFMVKNHQILTPKISDGALPGVMRSLLLKEFSHAFPIQEQSISVETLLDADEIFLTNALLGVKAVARLNHKLFTSCVVTQALSNQLQDKY